MVNAVVGKREPRNVLNGTIVMKSNHNKGFQSADRFKLSATINSGMVLCCSIKCLGFLNRQNDFEFLQMECFL
jgi:hypothetical protein